MMLWRGLKGADVWAALVFLGQKIHKKPPTKESGSSSDQTRQPDK